MGFVTYYRVSTKRQGADGLGILAQQAAVRQHLGEADPLAEFIEIESGKSHRNRPQLAAALEACRRHKAVLVIAKLDRLARNVAFVSGLLDSGVEFVCADNPHATKMMLQMLSVFAEFERELISTRIRQALERAKAKGTKLGVHSWKPENDWRAALAKARRMKDPRPPSQTVIDLMQHYRSEGLTLRAIAAKLNHDDHRTPKGKLWYASTVRKAMQREKSLETKELAAAA